MHEPKPNAGHPHAPAEVQQPACIKIPHLAHADATHAPPDEELELLEEELELLPDTHEPALHVPLVPPLEVQSEHVMPPVPQSVSICAIWQAPVVSQQPPAQLFMSQVAPLLDEPPASSPPLPLPLLLVA
jgi:hypothetical protein